MERVLVKKSEIEVGDVIVDAIGDEWKVNNRDGERVFAVGFYIGGA